MKVKLNGCDPFKNGMVYVFILLYRIAIWIKIKSIGIGAKMS